MKKYISVLIPVYNEGERIKKTITAVASINEIDKIYVINDGSTDDSKNILENIPSIELINLDWNQGKGRAIEIGLASVIDQSDIIVFLDGDVEESGVEVKKLIAPIINNLADVAVAKFPKAKTKGGFGLVKGLAKYGVYLNTGVLLDTVICGQRAFKKEVLRNISLPHNYGLEISTTIDILKMGYKIIEVDVNMHHKETGRDFRGFIHRGKQFIQILTALCKKTINR